MLGFSYNWIRKVSGCAALISITLPIHAAPAPVTVGNPANAGALAQALQSAYASGARKIIIRPGVYTLPNANQPDFTLSSWSNAVISAYHVTLIMTDLNHDCFDLSNCTNVTLEGPIISQNAVTFYQGKVISKGTGADGKPFVIWKPDVGYPVPTSADKTFLGGDVNVVDAQTRRLKLGEGDFYGIQYKDLGNGAFQGQMGNSNIAVGDWLVGRHGNAPFKVHVINSRDCTIKDVTLMRNGFAPLREEGGGGNHYLHDIWALGPRPAGATEDPLVTNAADGMHMTGSYPGPDIEDCVMNGVFLDDCIAIHGYFIDVTAVNGDVVTCKSNQWNVGDPIQLADTQGDFQEAKVTAINQTADGQWNITLDQPAAIHYIENNNTSSVSGDKIESKATNPLRNGAGYKIIGCQFGDTRSRGILAKADDGLIENNKIIGCGMSAVSLGPEFYWNEAGYVNHVIVQDNLIEGNGIAGYGGAAFFIHGDGAVGNSDIICRNNRFVSNYQGDFVIQWVHDATISHNTITGAKPWPAAIAMANMMSITNASHVLLQENTVKNAAVYKTPLVALGADATDVTNNNSTGFRIADNAQK